MQNLGQKNSLDVRHTLPCILFYFRYQDLEWALKKEVELKAFISKARVNGYF